MKKLITQLILLISCYSWGQQIIFQRRDNQFIDILDLESNFHFKDVLESNFPFTKQDGWEVVSLQNEIIFFQNTNINTEFYGFVYSYNINTNSTKLELKLSDVFDIPEKWTLTDIDTDGLWYFNSIDVNSEIVSYDKNTGVKIHHAYLQDFLRIPQYWKVKAVHEGIVYTQWVQNNTFHTTIKSWDGTTVQEYAIQNYYEDVFEVDIVSVTDDSPLVVDSSLHSKTSGYKDVFYPRGDMLKVYKLAVAVTSGSIAHYGGKEQTKQELQTWLDGINELYGRECAIHFELIENNDELLFEDSETDPWPDLPSGGICTKALPILNAQKSIIDGIIGAENYDFSHVIINVQGGGCASIGSTTRGATGRFTNAGRHELGHQLGQSHTIGYQNNPINFEQGGGWTIQGGNGNPYLHASSYQSTVKNVEGKFANLGVEIPTNNTIPTIQPSRDYSIPKQTPFVLTTNASDKETPEKLTYVWDAMNPWYVHRIPREDDHEGGLFKRFLPTTENYRFFPKLESILANENTTDEEQLPTQPRTMEFRTTVNDNHTIQYKGKEIAASGINFDDVTLFVTDAGPFEVTSQNTQNTSYLGGTSQTVTWNVNNTNIAPINTSHVKIVLSTDGGYSYDTVLDQYAPNNGEAQITLPNISSEKCRIRVEAIDNIYFDVNHFDFKIVYNKTLSIESIDIPKDNFVIYPIPIQNNVTIENTSEFITAVNLYSIQGILLRKFKLEQYTKATELNLQNFTDGFYFLEIHTLNGYYYKKIAIKKY